MTTTGWYGVISTGERQGNFNLDFADSAGNSSRGSARDLGYDVSGRTQSDQ